MSWNVCLLLILSENMPSLETWVTHDGTVSCVSCTLWTLCKLTKDDRTKILKPRLLSKEVSAGWTSDDSLRDASEAEHYTPREVCSKNDCREAVLSMSSWVKHRPCLKYGLLNVTNEIFWVLSLTASHRTARAIFCRCQTRDLCLNWSIDNTG